MLQGFVPSLYDSLGLFIPLIVVNCIILGRAEAFASKNSVGASFFDGLGMGIGFTLALCIISSFREIIGNGTWLGLDLFGGGYDPALIMIMAPGGFLTYGLVLAGMNWILSKRAAKKQEA